MSDYHKMTAMSDGEDKVEDDMQLMIVLLLPNQMYVKKRNNRIQTLTTCSQ